MSGFAWPTSNKERNHKTLQNKYLRGFLGEKTIDYFGNFGNEPEF